MSEVSVFVEKFNAFQDRLDKAIEGVSADVTFLKETIAKLQTNPGPISGEDQKLLDVAQQRVDGAAAKLEALDALTESAPVPPAEVPPVA